MTSSNPNKPSAFLFWSQKSDLLFLLLLLQKSSIEDVSPADSGVVVSPFVATRENSEVGKKTTNHVLKVSTQGMRFFTKHEATHSHRNMANFISGQAPSPPPHTHTHT